MDPYLLLILGLLLLIAEIFILSFGILALCGLAAVAYGLLQLHEAGALDWTSLSQTDILIVTALCAVLIALGGAYAYRQQRKRTQTGREGLIGEEADIIEWHGDSGRVRVMGELWRAESDSPFSALPGESVRISRMDDLTLTVEPLPPLKGA